MKNLKTIAIALFVVVSASQASAQAKKINIKSSQIEWVGKKVTGQHSGVVSFKDGSLNFKGDKVVGGSFVVDMNSIQVTDLGPNDGREKLEGHLKSDEFFGTEKFPTSKLVFKKVVDKGNGVYAVTADLTIKNVTNPVTFNMTMKGETAGASFSINRTKYGIKYGSGSFFDNLGDKAINDNFEVNVKIQL